MAPERVAAARPTPTSMLCRPSTLRGLHSLVPLHRWAARPALVIACAALAACTVGPDFRRPPAPEATGYLERGEAPQSNAQRASHPGMQQTRPELDVDARWWTAFGSPRIDALVDEALSRNPTLEAADAALAAARQNVLAQRGLFLPTVGVSASPSRTKIAGNQGGNSPGVQGDGSVISTYQGTPASEGGSAPFNAPVIYGFHTAQLTVSYAPDVFGANRRQVEDLQAQADAQRFQREAAAISLAANVVGAAIQEALLRHQIALTSSSIRQAENSTAIIRRQVGAGYASRLDLAQQEVALAQARQQLPALAKQQALACDLLKVLTGRRPDEALPALPDFTQIRLPAQLPLSLPARLVEQRPDIRAAEEQLHSASARVGVATAARLPQFSIDANWGGAAGRVSQMFLPSGRFFALSGTVAQTLFDGGQNKSRQAAAQANLQQADATYRATVLSALQNVADTLHAIQSNTAIVEAADQAQQRARAAHGLVERQLDKGYVDRLALITAQQALLQTEQSLAQAQATRLADTVALYQALGGGWWNRPAVAERDTGAPATGS